MQTYCIAKSVYVDDSIIYVSTEKVVDKINAACIKNHDNLQSVSDTKLMGKSKIFISTLIKNVKEKFQGNKVDVPFRTWKGAADELRDRCNIICKQNFF